MKKQNAHREYGFTLIELLVVIAIIGLLSSSVLASLSGARESARDTRRKQDMRQVKTALEKFYNENGKYPGEDGYCDSSIQGCPANPPEDGWDQSSQFYQELVGGGYMSTLPVDPINNENHYYRWEPSNDGDQGYYFRAQLEDGGVWGVCGGSIEGFTSWCH
ncbi:MAG: hypothetical protein BRC25_00020 [Parcubacteria group bacterium SW_6_46_9]|nr:MAG: hypothetical protein BRC25_00020 [Parcubacteria group bacterium SW_6_46_9]